MKHTLIIILFLTSFSIFAQKPKVTKASVVDKSNKVKTVKPDTPTIQWKNNVVENHFYKDTNSIEQDTIQTSKHSKIRCCKRKPKHTKMLKRKKRK